MSGKEGQGEPLYSSKLGVLNHENTQPNEFERTRHTLGGKAILYDVGDRRSVEPDEGQRPESFGATQWLKDWRGLRGDRIRVEWMRDTVPWGLKRRVVGIVEEGEFPIPFAIQRRFLFLFSVTRISLAATRNDVQVGRSSM